MPRPGPRTVYRYSIRGAITMGRFTHDVEHNISVGLPLNRAVDLERSAKLPSIEVQPEVLELLRGPEDAKAIYYDGDRHVLSIANVSTNWIDACSSHIGRNLHADLVGRPLENWKYIEKHLPLMHSAADAGR